MDKLSSTMRIDLIPDVPSQPVKGKRKQQVVIANPTRSHEPEAVVEAPVSVSPVAGGSESFEELLQSVYDGALITDAKGQILDANVRASEFLQYGREEFRGLTVFDVISGSNAELLDALLAKNERFTVITAFCIRKDTGFFPAEIAVNKLRLGDRLHLCFFVRDITVRRQQEEMLRTEHNAIQNSGNGIAVANLDWKLEYVNPAVMRMWGFDKVDDLLGADVRDLLGDRSVVDEMTETVTHDHQTWVQETKGRRRDETEFDVGISVTGNRNSEGDLVGTVFSFVDISDRKRAEGALREAEKQRVMLESLGAACHHLGQPATVLLANLGIMQKHLGGDSNDLVRELIHSSIEAAERLGEILHRLNEVNEYKTTQYLETQDGSDSPENRILQI